MGQERKSHCQCDQWEVDVPSNSFNIALFISSYIRRWLMIGDIILLFHFPISLHRPHISSASDPNRRFMYLIRSNLSLFFFSFKIYSFD